MGVQAANAVNTTNTPATQAGAANNAGGNHPVGTNAANESGNQNNQQIVLDVLNATLREFRELILQLVRNNQNQNNGGAVGGAGAVAGAGAAGAPAPATAWGGVQEPYLPAAFAANPFADWLFDGAFGEELERLLRLLEQNLPLPNFGSGNVNGSGINSTNFNQGGAGSAIPTTGVGELMRRQSGRQFLRALRAFGRFDPESARTLLSGLVGLAGRQNRRSGSLGTTPANWGVRTGFASQFAGRNPIGGPVVVVLPQNSGSARV